jgi:hypothetical protein
LIAGSINEILTPRSPIIPPRLFKTRTTAMLLVSVFIHAMAFFSATYCKSESYYWFSDPRLTIHGC